MALALTLASGRQALARCKCAWSSAAAPPKMTPPPQCPMCCEGPGAEAAQVASAGATRAKPPGGGCRPAGDLSRPDAPPHHAPLAKTQSDPAVASPCAALSRSGSKALSERRLPRLPTPPLPPWTLAPGRPPQCRWTLHAKEIAMRSQKLVRAASIRLSSANPSPGHQKVDCASSERLRGRLPALSASMWTGNHNPTAASATSVKRARLPACSPVGGQGRRSSSRPHLHTKPRCRKQYKTSIAMGCGAHLCRLRMVASFRHSRRPRPRNPQ